MSRFVDLSVTVDENTFSPPSTNMKLEVTPHRRGPGFWQVSSVNQSLHTGAHIDSPLHVFKNGITTAEIMLDQVMGEALVVDLSFVGANHEITIDDLKKGGAGDVKRGDIVLLKTGWTDQMYGRWPDYFTRSPYLPPGAAQLLVERGPKNIGFDFFEEYCARLPDFTSEDFAMHRVILGAGVVIMERLTRSFGSLTAVNAVSLTVRKGELRSIIGPNGAGKTTFFRLVSGEMEPSSGRVLFQESDITGLPQHRVCRLGIAKSYQITNIFPHLSVLENVRVAVQGYARSFNFWSRADQIAGCRERAVEILATVSLVRQAERPAAHLSHGEKRHLEIGIALASDPALLLLDEPTAGMSPEETDETMVLIRELARGRTV